jgi:hypothetical protein
MKVSDNLPRKVIAEELAGSAGAVKTGSGIWCLPPAILELVDNEVHVWIALLGTFFEMCQ